MSSSRIADLNVRLGMEIKEFEYNRRKALRGLKNMGREFQDIGNKATMAVSLPIIGIGTAAIQAAGQVEVMEKSLTAMMGSGEAARSEMEKLRKVAQDPGLNFNQAVKGSVRLQAVGVSADLARRALSAMGNAITLAGGTSADLDGVTLALTQIISKGKVSAEEINQLAERVPQVRKAMMNLFGTADTEAIQKLGIEAEDFVEKIIGEFEKLPKAQGGILNSIENIGQAATQFLADLGNDLATDIGLQEILNDIADKITALGKAFKSLSPETKKTIFEIGALALAFGPAVKLIGATIVGIRQLRLWVLGFAKAVMVAREGNVSFIKSFQKLNLMSTANAVTLLVAAIGAAIIAFRHFKRQVNDTVKVTNKAKESIIGERLEAERLTDVLKSETASRVEKEKALKRLQSINPTYFKGLQAEKSSVEDINRAYDAYVANLLRAAKAQAAQEEILKLEKEKLSIINQLEDPDLLTKTLDFLSGGIGPRGYAGSRRLISTIKEIETRQKALSSLMGPGFLSGMGQAVSGKIGGFFNKEEKIKEADIDTEVTRQKVDNLAELMTAEELYLLYNKEGYGELVVNSMNAASAQENFKNRVLEVHDAITEKVNKTKETFRSLHDVMSEAAEGAANAMLSAAAAGETSFKRLGKAALKGAADEVRAALMSGVANAVRSALTNVPFPFNLAAAGAAGAAAGVLFNKLLTGLKIPAFAEGGIVTGPTLAMVGDNRSGTEAIIPLEKFGDMFGGKSSPAVNVQILATRQGLVAMIEDGKRERDRLSGF